MASEFEDHDESSRPRSRRWLWRLLGVFLIFLIGAGAMGWAMLRWQPLDSFLHTRFGTTLPVTLAAPPVGYPQAVHIAAPMPVPGQVAALSSQLGELGHRLDAIDRRARAASGNADRAEGLLVAFAARRALDRGIGLGYIEALLRDRFGRSQPQAVATIIGASRTPVTLAWLEAELERIAPSLNGHAGAADWWTVLKREMGDLIVIRRAGQPTPDPADRLGRARRALESGQADVALAEIARIPGNAAAAAWIASARRYISSRAALDRIETAALLEPRAASSASADDRSSESDEQPVTDPPAAPDAALQKSAPLPNNWQ